MTNEEITKELEKNKKVVIVSEINYKEKKYIKTLKYTSKKLIYIYYEIKGEEVIEVKDEQLLLYFRENYECKPSNIIF